jgi:hypothetical protein
LLFFPYAIATLLVIMPQKPAPLAEKRQFFIFHHKHLLPLWNSEADKPTLININSNPDAHIVTIEE